MAKWSLGSYNRFLGASMTRYGLTRRQAAESYRGMREKLGPRVFRTDLEKHPRYAKKAAERGLARRPPVPKKPPPGGGAIIGLPIELPEGIEEEFEDDGEIEFSEESE